MTDQRESERTIWLVNPRSPGERLAAGPISFGVPMAYGVIGSMADSARKNEGFPDKEVGIKFINENLYHHAEPRQGDLVLVSSFSQTAKRAETIIQEVTNQGAFAVVGGIHSTLAPENFSTAGALSFQGEAGNSVMFNNVLHDWLHNGTLDRGTIVQSEGLSNPKAISLAGLPVSSEIYSQLDRNLFSRGTFAVVGCPSDCDFCTVMGGRVVRERPVEEVVEELKVRGLNRTGFTLFDSNLGAAPDDYIHNLLESFAPLEIPRGWTVEISMNLLERGGNQLLDTAAAAHCHRFMVGLETPNEQNLKSVHKYQNVPYSRNPDRVKEVVTQAHKRGIKISGLYIVGFKPETVESIRNIEQSIKYTGVDDANIFVLTPFPGTKLWQQLSTDGLFNPKTVNTDELDQRHLVFNHPLGNDVVLQEYQRLCNRVFSTPAVLSRSAKAFFMSVDHHLPKEVRQAFISSFGWELTQADLHRKLGIIDGINKFYDTWRQLSGN